MFENIHTVQLLNKEGNISTSTNASLGKILDTYVTLFDGKIGEIKGEPASLILKPGAKLPSFRARPIPFALKDRL